MTTATTPPHVEVGDRVVVSGDPMTHVVSWTNHRSWDAACGLIIEDYQPDYYQSLLDIDDSPMYMPGHPEYRDPDDIDYSVNHPALALQVAPDDAPITCLQCLFSMWRPPDQRDVFSDVDE
jgi:hypothetical protein